MKCPHCNVPVPHYLPYRRRLDGGRAYAQTCRRCGRIVRLRSNLESDPPTAPPEFTEAQAARLLFLRWRLQKTTAGSHPRSMTARVRSEHLA